MKVNIPEISDKELSDMLMRSGIDCDAASLAHCGGDEEKLRILRRTRNSLLDAIHEKQAVLDRLDYMIWCTEHRGGVK
ncbi:MAG: hypothetical protein II695_06990 [Oscillospiraceae bacterium]|nr:hypothetical protein [Oscillospiraceae bacterium]